MPLRLCTLRPTSEALEQSVLQAHLQVAIVKNALVADPAALAVDPKIHG